MRILFVGESWLGSCARSVKEALARQPGIEIDEISEDTAFQKPKSMWLKVLARLTHNAYQHEFMDTIAGKVDAFKPDAMVVYKGWSVDSSLFRHINRHNVPVINIYPDNSPHAHGSKHRIAVGLYDAVISTKPYHPELWQRIYGYDNPCYFIPQGYDPNLSLIPEPPAQAAFDVVMAATFRPEYSKLLEELAAELPADLSIAIAGNGWQAKRHWFPAHWQFVGALHGRSYTAFLRSGRVVVAPMTTHAMVTHAEQPGDVDTTRTYELAAAHCFFIHRHSDYVRQLYTDQEVPTFHNGKELAQQIMHFLPQPELRRQMALAAHQRAVPAYSLDSRARDIIEIIKHTIHNRQAATLPASHTERE